MSTPDEVEEPDAAAGAEVDEVDEAPDPVPATAATERDGSPADDDAPPVPAADPAGAPASPSSSAARAEADDAAVGEAADEPVNISRRTALGIIGVSAAMGALGVAIVRRDAGPEPPLQAPGTAAADGGTVGVAALGQAYLDEHPEEATREALLAGLGVADDAFGDPNAQLDALAAQIEADFAAGNTTTADGWLLSLTEARLAGLVALQDQG